MAFATPFRRRCLDAITESVRLHFVKDRSWAPGLIGSQSDSSLGRDAWSRFGIDSSEEGPRPADTQVAGKDRDMAMIQKMSARRHLLGYANRLSVYDCSSCWMRSRRVLMMSSLLTSERLNRILRKNL